MNNISDSTTLEQFTIFTQTPYSHPNWLLKILPWVSVRNDIYEINSINFEKPQQQRLSIPKNANLLIKTDSYFLSDLLRCVPLFQPLSEELIKEIMKGVYQKNVEAGDIIVKQGAIGKAFYIIINGDYNVTNRTVNDEEIILNSLTSGDYFGEMALLKEIPRQATITATTKGSLIVLSKETFETIVSDEKLKKQLEEVCEVRNKELKAIKQSNENKPFVTQFDEPPFPDNYPNSIQTSIQNKLDIIQATINLDAVCDAHYTTLLNKQLQLTADRINTRQEWEIINNKRFGLLHNIPPSMSCSANSSIPTPDDFDHLLSLVWNKPSFFLAHPKTIEVFAKQCTKQSLTLNNVKIFGGIFLTWRGVPIIPSNNMRIDAVKKTTQILLIRTGQKEEGVIGLYNKDRSNIYKIPNLIVEPIVENDKNRVSKYKITKHFSVVVLSLDSIAVLQDVKLECS